MLEALEEHFGEQARWTKPQGGLFMWATLDERIDTTDLLAQARESEGVAFVPGRAAYMDGRRGSSSMRLNFAGVPDEDIREGIRRIGKVVREQVGLYGTLTGSSSPAKPPAESAPEPAAEQAPRWPTSSRSPAAIKRDRRAGARIDERRQEGGGAEGRALARAQRLAALGRARAGGARAPRARGRRDRRRLAARGRLRAAKPDAAFIALHGPDGEDGTMQALLEAIGIPYTGSGPGRVHVRHRQGARQAPDARRRHPHARLPLAARGVDQGAGRRRGAAGRRGARSASRWSSSPPARARRWASSSRATSEELPGALVGAFSYDRKVLIERYVKGRDLAVSVLDGPSGPVALPVVEAVPREEDFYDYESRYEIGMTTFVCPAELPDDTTARAQELALEVYRLLGCRGVARVDLMLDEHSGELWVLETNVIPGMTETSLLPQAADAAGISFDELISRLLDSAFTR